MKTNMDTQIMFKLAAIGLIFALLGCSPKVEYSPIPTEISLTTSLPSPTVTKQVEPTQCPSPETAMPEPGTPENYIGKVFDPLHLPNGLNRTFGNLIELSDFALAQVTVSSNGLKMIWLSEIKCRNDYVHDVLVLPTLNSNQMLVTSYCRINGKEDPEILAIGEFETGTIPLKTIDQAWRANRQAAKFEEIATTGIECWRDIGINSP